MDGDSGINLLELSCSDVENPTNHKNANHLAIVEEGDNSDTPSNEHLNEANHDGELSSVTSSAENLAANTKANEQSLYSHKQSSKSLNESHDHSRRPSVVLQELLTTRRPSAIMASLRRGSQSILSPFRTKTPDDPNDPARSPEAVEYRRKNRRIGE